MSEIPAFLNNSLDKLLTRIDKESARLERMKGNPRISEGARQEIEKKILDLRKTRWEITQLMSRLERL